MIIHKIYVLIVRTFVTVIGTIGILLLLGAVGFKEGFMEQYFGVTSSWGKLGIVIPGVLLGVFLYNYITEKESRLDKFWEVVALIFGIVFVGWVAGLISVFLASLTNPYTEDILYERGAGIWVIVYAIGLIAFIKWYNKHK